MAKLGTEKNPIFVRVQSMEAAKEVMEKCGERDWKVTVGIEPDKPADISDLERMIDAPDIRMPKMSFGGKRKRR